MKLIEEREKNDLFGKEGKNGLERDRYLEKKKRAQKRTSRKTKIDPMDKMPVHQSMKPGRPSNF